MAVTFVHKIGQHWFTALGEEWKYNRLELR